MQVPKPFRHTLPDTAAAILPRYEEFRNLESAHIAEPLIRRPDQRKPGERFANLCQVDFVPIRPKDGRVIRITPVRFGIEIEPLGHVMNVMLEQIPKDYIGFASGFRDHEIGRRRHRIVKGQRDGITRKC